MNMLHVLLVDDDKEGLAQIDKLFPDALRDAAREKNLELDIEVDSYSDFTEAVRRIKLIRYDLVISDIYQGVGSGRVQTEQGARAKEVVDAIKASRFSPILLYTSSSRPDWLKDSVFLRYVDKADGDIDGLIEQTLELISTGIPAAARAIHDGIDSQSAEYIWGFFDKDFEDHHLRGDAVPDLERILRRRVATTMSKIDSGTGGEASIVSGIEYYIYPKISQGEYRLGEIIKTNEEYRIILTPHCQLHVQQGSAKPKADNVLTAKLVPARELLALEPARNVRKLGEKLRGKIGKPEGRYFFLPGILSMDDSYCDFMQLESVPFEKIENDFKPHAVLDTPFAESLQARFAAFYGSVGTPDLNPSEFSGLLPSEPKR